MEMLKLKWLLITLLIASYCLNHGRRRSFSQDFASLASEPQNPLTEFSNFDQLIVNWVRIIPTSHDVHQTHWLDIVEAAHCDGVPDHEVIWLEGSHEFHWEPSQKIVIPSYSHSYETRLTGQQINQATFALSAQMQAHGCKPEAIQFELMIVPKFKSSIGQEQTEIPPEIISINRSSNEDLQTGNSRSFKNGLGVWTLSRGS